MNHSQIEFLKLCLQKEVIKSDTKEFSWRRAIQRAWKHPERRFYFWWRIASFLYKSNKNKNIAEYINRKLLFKYNCDIHLNTKIKEGMKIHHFVGVVINENAVIGKNFNILQNSTIAVKTKGCSDNDDRFIKIGDNVTIGAFSCIMGDQLTIGNNVIIGAMSFINHNVDSNRVVYTKKLNNIIINKDTNKKYIT
ncbi:serine acetyltransferase [Proteus mirabilis]|uniref:serine O-acetyltransferase n=1 Tax=Proteus TaxID=583 RepID=UPI0008E70D04|nr:MULTISPECIES: serine acetyltransferase [Proteus]MDC5897991.1 serine acetyltransferase [Proteus mirabilis]MDC5901467.1 serine acetyltransferase [Proteus mirabilis]MDC5919123.1 serine acetyltransferase [Proteus mirabilis]MDC5929647.1 serine acetyltransferase [Proteus mirabilis]MDC5936680.1 serine acetyltransferase [Proteus mirabilis]